MSAIDPDAGANAKITYRIFGGVDMGHFELSVDDDEDTAKHGFEIRTRTELDYEIKNEYRLQVQASSGDLSSVVDVTIRILDQNDHAPELNDFYLVIANYEHGLPYFSSNLGRVPARLVLSFFDDSYHVIVL